MRLLNEVITEACKVPNIPTDLKEQLENIRDKHLPWCPPESAKIWWKEAQIFINAHMPSKPEELVDWQKAFLKVWTGKDW